MTNTIKTANLIELSDTQIREKDTEYTRSVGCRLVFPGNRPYGREEFLHAVQREAPSFAQAYTQVSQKPLLIGDREEDAFIVEYFRSPESI